MVPAGNSPLRGKPRVTSEKRVLRGCQPHRNLNCVGPDKYKIASDGLRNRGAPTGASRSTRLPSPQPSSSSTTGNGDDQHFKCQFPGCKRSFTTKTECGVHMRRAHYDWTDGVNRTETVKARWTQEEISLLPCRESELSLRGVRFINQECLGFLPVLTLE